MPQRPRRPFAFLFLVALALPALVRTDVSAAESDRIHLVVLHTNDVHGQVLPRPATWLRDVDPVPNTGGLARVAEFVSRVRAEEEAAGAAVVVVDAGDWFQGTPEGLVDRGRAFVEAMDAVGYDAMTVGNHEFDHGVDVLLGHLDALETPALLANVKDWEGRLLPHTQAYRIVERGGLRIAIVGLLTTSTPSITHASTRALNWIEPRDALAAIETELGDAVDWLLPVTHCGIGEDRRLAREHPGLDLIVGGHSHTFLEKGVVEGDTLVVQAGSKATGVGRVDLWFDPVTKEVVEKKATVINLYDEPEGPHVNAAVEACCDALVAASAKRMDEVVGSLPVRLERGREPVESSLAGNLITDVMRERTGAHVALQNRGGIRKTLEAGPITRRDLFEVLPFGNHLVTLTISGTDLVETMRQSIEGGAGTEFSGITIEVRRAQDGWRVARILVAGEPVQPEGRYRLTTNSFMAGGGGGFSLLEAATEREVDPIMMRDLMEAAFAGGELTPPGDNRFVVLK